MHAAVDGEVDFEIFHRRVNEFFDGGTEPVNFVYKKNVACVYIAEQSHDVACFDQCRAG